MKYLILMIVLGCITQRMSAQSNASITNYPLLEGETKILMADNSEKEISKIKKGDSIFALSSLPPFLNYKIAKVKKISREVIATPYHILCEDGAIVCSNSLLLYKTNQNDNYVWAAIEPKEALKFYIVKKKVPRLKIDDYLLNQNGDIFDQTKITDIIQLKITESYLGYRLELEGYNVFIANGFIVKCK